MSRFFADPELLTHDNYATWRFRILSLMKEEKCDPRTDLDEDQKAKALRIIRMTVSVGIIPLIEDTFDPTVAWLTLQKALGTSSRNSRFNKLRQLISIRKSTSETYHQYVAKASQLFNDIMGMQIIKEERVIEVDDRFPRELLPASIINGLPLNLQRLFNNFDVENMSTTRYHFSTGAPRYWNHGATDCPSSQAQVQTNYPV